MLDIRLIRENPKLAEDSLKKRGDTEKIKDLGELIKSDEQRRELIKKTELLKKKRNEITREISALKAKGKPAEDILKQARKLDSEIEDSDKELGKLNEKSHKILMNLPNILHDSVPSGRDENDNVVIKTDGKLKFDFEPKNHLDLALSLGLIDEERAAKAAGRGFFYLKNELALLDFAIIRYAADFLMKKGFALIEPPFMLRRKPYEGVVSLQDFENVMYKIEGEDFYMIATSEHAIASMLMDEVVLEKDLPLKFAGVSPCFRKEIGAHGKYTKGLFRVHQFNKVEQFVFCKPEESWQLFEELQKNSEQLYQNLGIAFRTVSVCTKPFTGAPSFSL